MTRSTKQTEALASNGPIRSESDDRPPFHTDSASATATRSAVSCTWSTGELAGAGRDLRIDFFRGLALFLIYTDHISRNSLSAFTLQRFGFTDAAEIFVFLSGYVSGLVYGKVYTAKGLLLCQAKALHRCWQIYVVHILSVFAVLGLLYEFASRSVFIDFDIYYFLRDPLGTWWNALLLRFGTYLIDVLPLYIVFVAATPLAIWLLSRNQTAILLLAASVSAYVLSQFVPAFNFPAYPRAVWSFNPFAWQFLFTAALLLGYRGRQFRWAAASNRRIIAGAALGLAVIAFFRCADSGRLAALIHTTALQTLIPKHIPLIQKSNLGPLRLVNFALLCLAAAQLAPSLRFWRSRVARPVIVCGQNSLEVFGISLVLSTLAGLLIAGSSGGGLMSLLVTAGGLGLLIGAAWTVRWFKSAPWRRELTTAHTESHTPLGRV